MKKQNTEKLPHSHQQQQQHLLTKEKNNKKRERYNYYEMFNNIRDDADHRSPIQSR